jgi:hypothetical protein
MIVMGEYVHVEGRYGKAFIKVSGGLVCGIPICMFLMDENCRGVAITLQVSVSLRALV